MPRADFDRDLRMLQDDILMLGSMVEKAIMTSLDALQRRDLDLSKEIIRGDDHIDNKTFEIEDKCINLIATQQPLAIDLRIIIAMLHISQELERMGDYAEGIAKISLAMGDEPPLKKLIDIPRMGQKSSNMVRLSLDSLVNRDLVTAQVVLKDDDEIDALYEQVYRELLTFMIEDPKSIRRGTYLMWVAHDLERIADRATNIAERVIYLVTGRLAESLVKETSSMNNEELNLSGNK